MGDDFMASNNQKDNINYAVRILSWIDIGVRRNSSNNLYVSKGRRQIQNIDLESRRSIGVKSFAS
jgi:hypothetical protein